MKTTIALFALLSTLVAGSPLEARGGGGKCDTAPYSSGPKVSTPLHTLMSLGAYAPWVSQQSALCRDTPSGFTIDQVSIVSRHGARSPTASQLQELQATIAKATSAKIADDAFAFVKDYSLDGYTADQLTDYGRRQLYDSGATMAKRYKKLAKNTFTRSASQDRVVESGKYFIQGFSGKKFQLLNATQLTPPDLIVSEEDGMNNTMAAVNCPGYDEATVDPGDVAEDNWTAIFAPPITARLNEKLVGANFSDADVVNLMSMCGYDGIKNLEYAAGPWCSVFTTEEWDQNEYWFDVSKYWGRSWGNPFARPRYAGYINEFISRLTGQPVVLGGSTNSTLDTNAATFPLDKTLYADFTHDNDMVALMAALQIWRDDPLPTQVATNQIPRHHFNVSHIVPFAARFVIERLSNKQGAKYVRILINDAVTPMDFPDCGDYQWAGMCELDAWVAAQSYSQNVNNYFGEICGSQQNVTVLLQ